jgi:salicylate hydroxylase
MSSNPPPEFTHPPNKPFNIAVIGGGIGGLTLTLALLQHRILVTLYEAAPKFGEIGAGVSFGSNASRTMKLISPRIYNGFQNRATFTQDAKHSGTWFSFQYGEDVGQGNEIGALPGEGGHAAVHRPHYLDELVELLPDGVAVFGKKAVGFEQSDQGVVVKFEDGSKVKHDAVVGCDGIKSRTRLYLLGEQDPAAKADYSGTYAYRGLIPMDKAKELLGSELAQNSQMYLGRHGHVLTFAIEKRKTMNVVAFSSSSSWDSPDWVVHADSTMTSRLGIPPSAASSPSSKDLISGPFSITLLPRHTTKATLHCLVTLPTHPHRTKVPVPVCA